MSTTTTDSGNDRPRMTWDGDTPPLDRCTPAARAVIEGDTRTREPWWTDTLRRPIPTKGPGTIWGGAGGVPILYRIDSGHIIMDECRPDGRRVTMRGPVSVHGRRAFLHRAAEAMGLRITGDIEEVDTDD